MRLGDLDALALHLKGVAECYRKDNENSFAALVVEETIALDVMDFPTIDAVPVCRCKDCIHYEPCESGKDFCCFHATGIVENDFCSYGERKDGDG